MTCIPIDDDLNSHGRVLPALPTVLEKLTPLLQDRDTDIQAVARLIQLDSGIAANTLRIANSAFYGMQRHVGSVQEAIVILGFQNVYSLILGYSVAKAMQQATPDAGAFMTEFWHHSVAVACTARLLATASGQPDPETFFTAGLLHDIGKPVLMQRYPQQYQQVLARVRNREGPCIDMETQALEADHTDVGRRLCTLWNLPESLVRAAGDHHHQLGPGTGDLCNRVLRLVVLADNLVKLQQYSIAGNSVIDLPNCAEAMAGHMMNGDELLRVLAKLPGEIHNAREMLELGRPLTPAPAASGTAETGVGLVFADRAMEEICSLCVQALGYTPQPNHQVRGDVSGVSALISDDALPGASGDLPVYSRLPVYRVAAQRYLDVEHLKEWLRDNVS